MRDFPIFTTEYGVSSLYLKEIPYKNTAYIRIRDVQPGQMQEHLKECVSFCRMVGADHIYAAGDGLEAYPLYTSVLEMRGTAWADPEKTACLFPVTKETVSRWREIHNRAMSRVDNAGTLEFRDEPRILEKPGAYFVHENGTILGIGWIDDGKLLAVAAEQKGEGQRVMHTLMSLMEGQTLTLEVASTNTRAIALYERLGFLKTAELTQWHTLTI